MYSAELRSLLNWESLQSSRVSRTLQASGTEHIFHHLENGFWVMKWMCGIPVLSVVDFSLVSVKFDFNSQLRHRIYSKPNCVKYHCHHGALVTHLATLGGTTLPTGIEKLSTLSSTTAHSSTTNTTFFEVLFLHFAGQTVNLSLLTCGLLPWCMKRIRDFLPTGRNSAFHMALHLQTPVTDDTDGSCDHCALLFRVWSWGSMSPWCACRRFW